MANNPRRVEVTEAIRQTIRTLRAAGQSWDVVAAAVGHARQWVIDAARGMDDLPACIREIKPADPGGMTIRPPLPAGHRETWALITVGTVLEGVPYPPYRTKPERRGVRGVG